VRVQGIEIPRPEKELFADGTTKGDLATYYADVARRMLPHLRDRVVSMQRFPDGVEAGGFYEKRVPGHFPDWVRRARVDTDDGSQEQVVVQDARTLAYLAGQACITPHTWLSRVERPTRPDQMVFDLDPSVDDLAAVRRATRLTGDLLGELGLPAYLKTTGSRGYHVVVPLRAELDFDEVRDVAHRVAALLARREPDLLTVEQRTSERGDRVFVDYLRNGYGQTAVPPYAVRARERPSVATPIPWDDLGRVRPDQYTVGRPRRGADPWQGMRRRATGLRRARQRLDRLEED